VLVDQVLGDLARIQEQTRTITNREQHLREVITLTTITTAVEEVPMYEVQVAEVALLPGQALAHAHQDQVEEINIHIHSNYTL
jgi:hypothetical protein